MATTVKPELTPGSKDSIERGCICNPLNNHYGRGLKVPGNEPIYWKHEDCPLHGVEIEMTKGECYA